ncbi:phage virion morphogenesis protein [Aeromonas enteropelogenes]|uniref:phage virion morphogenesis protein n=1 Tax=Aeromonas enteropelogenes TaxID=29489 RepID=UPI003B9F3B6E
MNDAAATERSSRRLRDQLRQLALPPKKRRQILAKVGREAAKVSRANIRKLKAPDGSAFAPIKAKRKPPHIKRMAKRLRSKADTNNATLFFVGSHAGIVPPRIHFGDQETGRAPRRKNQRPRLSERGKNREPFKHFTAPQCTRWQAIELHRLGYAVLSQRGKRRRYRKPSARWIQENVGMAKAGIMIRMMRDEPVKKSWTIKTPARPLLPKANDPALIVLMDKVVEGMLWTH